MIFHFTIRPCQRSGQTNQTVGQRGTARHTQETLPRRMPDTRLDQSQRPSARCRPIPPRGRRPPPLRPFRQEMPPCRHSAYLGQRGSRALYVSLVHPRQNGCLDDGLVHCRAFLCRSTEKGRQQTKRAISSTRRRKKGSVCVSMHKGRHLVLQGEGGGGGGNRLEGHSAFRNTCNSTLTNPSVYRVNRCLFYIFIFSPKFIFLYFHRKWDIYIDYIFFIARLQ